LKAGCGFVARNLDSSRLQSSAPPAAKVKDCNLLESRLRLRRSQPGFIQVAVVRPARRERLLSTGALLATFERLQPA
jgi:hypothetical protein